MKPVHRFFIAAAFGLVLVLSWGCTKEDVQQAEKVEEKGKIDQMTDQVAEKAVKKIRTPMDKARATRNLGDDRMEAMDKAIQQQ